MLQIAQKLYVGGFVDLCEMYKIVHTTMWPKVSVSLMKKQVCLYRKKIMKVRSFERYIPFNEWLPIASLPGAREKDGIWEVNVTD